MSNSAPRIFACHRHAFGCASPDRPTPPRPWAMTASPGLAPFHSVKVRADHACPSPRPRLDGTSSILCPDSWPYSGVAEHVEVDVAAARYRRFPDSISRSISSTIWVMWPVARGFGRWAAKDAQRVVGGGEGPLIGGRPLPPGPGRPRRALVEDLVVDVGGTFADETRPSQPRAVSQRRRMSNATPLRTWAECAAGPCTVAPHK